MIKFILAVIFIYMLVLLPELRYALKHLPTVTYQGVKDIKDYFKYKKYNEYTGFGKMLVFTASDTQPFGSGKTLNLVRFASAVYKRFDGVDVWSDEKQKFVKQRIRIVSNLTLYNIPYVPFVSEKQIIECKEDSNVVTIFLLDEAGSCFNSRNWKTNLSEDLLNSILQQRKNKVAVWCTVQDFSLMDATMRKLTTYVYTCKKTWRFLVLRQFYAKDIERAQYNSLLVRPASVRCAWATDKLYNSYNTNQIVEKLKKDVADGKMLTNQEILLASDGSPLDIASLTRTRGRYRRHARK